MKKNKFYKLSEDNYFETPKDLHAYKTALISEATRGTHPVAIYYNTGIGEMVLKPKNLIKLDDFCKDLLLPMFEDIDNLNLEIQDKEFEKLSESFDSFKLCYKKTFLSLIEYLKHLYDTTLSLSSYMIDDEFEVPDDNTLKIIHNRQFDYLDELQKLNKDYYFEHSVLAMFNGVQKFYNEISNTSYFTSECLLKDKRNIVFNNPTEESEYINDNLPYLSYLVYFYENFFNLRELVGYDNKNLLPQTELLSDYNDCLFFDILFELDHTNYLKDYVYIYYSMFYNTDDEFFLQYPDLEYHTFEYLIDKYFVADIIRRNNKRQEIVGGFDNTNFSISYEDLEYFHKRDELNSLKFYTDEDGNETVVVNAQQELKSGLAKIFEMKDSSIANDIISLLNSSDEDLQALLDEQIATFKELQKQERMQAEQMRFLNTIHGKNDRGKLSHTLLNSFQTYFKLLKTNEDEHLERLQFLLRESENKSYSLANPEYCSFIFLSIYVIMATIKGDELGLDNFDMSKDGNSEAYNVYKESLDGVQRIPGWIDINEIRHQPWEPKLESINSDFWKYYSTFYNYATSEDNPFNDFLEDEHFENMQNLAKKAKYELHEGFNREVQELLSDLFYGPQELTNNHSVWTFTNILGDLFEELETPIETDVILGNLGSTFTNFFKNVTGEITSTVLLELLMQILGSDFLKIGGVARNIMGVYNDLLVASKMFEAMDKTSGNSKESNKVLEEIEGLKTTMLSTDNLIGRLLDEHAYFSVDGLDFFSTDLSTLLQAVGISDLTNNPMVEKLRQFGEESDIDGLWNLFSYDLPTWYLIKTITSGFDSLNYVDRNFHEYKDLKTLVNTSDIKMKKYAFLCSIRPMYNISLEQYLEKEIKEGVYTGILDMEDVLDMATYFPNIDANKNFNYGTNYNNVIQKYPGLFEFSMTDEFKVYESRILKVLPELSETARLNRNTIGNYLLKQESSVMTDTIARLLPTTSLMSNLGIPIKDYVDKLLSYFDKFIISGLKLIFKFSESEKTRTVDYIHRELRYIMRTNYSKRIKAFSTLLDIIYSETSSIYLCLSTGSTDSISTSYNVLKKIQDKLSNINDNLNDGGDNNNNTITNPGTGSGQDDVGTDFDVIDNETTDEEIRKELEKELENKVIFVPGSNGGISSDSTGPIFIVDSGSDINEIEKEYEQEGSTIIGSDEDLLDAIKNDSVNKVEIVGGDFSSSIKDFLKPSDDKLVNDAKEEIINGIVQDTIDRIFQEHTDQGKKVSSNNILRNTSEIRDSFGYDDLSHINSIDFSGVNTKMFLKNLSEFDMKNYMDFKYTTLKMFNKF